MKNLYISELLLLSQKEKKAKRVVFDRKRTLIHGKNHTGKSSLIKSIYRTFGAEPLLNPKFKDSNSVSLVKFEFNGDKYQILRDGKRFAIYDGTDNELARFDSVTNELAPYLGRLFNFTPLFPNTQGSFIIPPPAYQLLPFYVDQDESWNKSWFSFRSLQQIKGYREHCISFHSGTRPNEYYNTKKEIQEYIKIIEETDKEKTVTKRILDDIKEKLSQAQFNVDIDQFKDELTGLLIELETLKKKQDKLKNTLHDLYHLKATYDAQIGIVQQAIKESHQDLEFISTKLPETVDCPTCGAEYENSFAERFEIAQDEQRSKDLLIELQRESRSIEEKIETESNLLTSTLSEVERVDKILSEKKGDLQLKDVIESAGKNQVQLLFKERAEELNRALFDAALKKDDLDKKLKSCENKDRKKEIRIFYQSKMTSFLKQLDVHSLNQDDYKSISTPIENLETGSSRPRALIAYYFTFFHLIQKYSTSTYFPLIIDSPNQQDQDIEHIDKIMQFIKDNQPEDSQMILGVAETYGVDFECPVISLNEKYSLLQASEYESVHNELDDKLMRLWFG